MPSPHPSSQVIRTVSFSASGREYVCGPARYAVICLDGSSDEYLNASMVRGLMPALTGIIQRGGRFVARSVLPSFTNPNNASIITGVPPAIHGIPGNFFVDPATGRERMMNSGEFLRATPITSHAARAGRTVAIITAKDKLRTILAKDLPSPEDARLLGCPAPVAVSAEKAGDLDASVHGLSREQAASLAGPAPEIYSADASVYVLRLGAALFEAGLTDFAYLSTTDFIQHGHGPDEPEALEFYRRLDEQLGRLDAAGVRLAITADHGMNAKQDAHGAPMVTYLSPVVREVDPGAKVILPITDPYVRHHASLGSYAGVHASDPSRVPALLERLWSTPGVAEVHDRVRAVRLLELPPDRTADIVVLASRHVAFGTEPAEHDLSVLSSGLRSHGGRTEECVPLIVSHPLSAHARQHMRTDPRNFDAWHLVTTGSPV